jgi:peptidoglycan hydrolase-like protein with peptidoglycan-binding domain
MEKRTTAPLAAVMTTCALAAGLAAAPAAVAQHPAGENTAATRPAVNMEAVLLAAQWDPRKPGTTITRGARGSVIRVERALARRGYLSRTYVDGHFGTSTVAAYAAWQRHLGYSGLGATGLPGPTSLVRLGSGRFRVTHLVSPGRHVTYGGQTVNLRTKHMLRAAAHRISPSCAFTLVQGSYHPGSSSSAGTHDGGGAADISVGSLCGKKPRQVVRALRKVGFAAWHRLTIPGLWNEHIHAIAISDPDLSTAAQHQVGDYYQGRNGLADGGPDHGPQVRKITWEQYKRSH